MEQNFPSKNDLREVVQLTLVSVVDQVHRSGSKPTTNREILEAVREQFANQCGAGTFPWNAALVLKAWKEYQTSSEYGNAPRT